MASKADETSQSSPEAPGLDGDGTKPEQVRFSPEEEAALLAESNEQKLLANTLFGSTRYSEAIQEYDKALQSCPNYLDYEVAVLRSNIAACHLKLEDWKAAVTAATASIESLDRLDPPKDAKEDAKEADGADVTRKSAVSATAVQRIKAKSLLRRAKARCELGGWAALQGAEEGQQGTEPANNKYSR
ncbi:hypothetical protein GP486_007102 [Trichoglossum hirsutum]|uniref:Tetratricopeptide repeat protein 1 n=1 Tax=Trichoglossum hirsutum TaxID=265104 RepID=A0A9P8IJP9_9PEZI|nr:hypothetical protein GP486_007102 [Trichoglossum hirsutum]